MRGLSPKIPIIFETEQTHMLDTDTNIQYEKKAIPQSFVYIIAKSVGTMTLLC